VNGKEESESRERGGGDEEKKRRKGMKLRKQGDFENFLSCPRLWFVDGARAYK